MIMKGFIMLSLLLLAFTSCNETPVEETKRPEIRNEFGEIEEPDLPVPNWMDKDTLKRKKIDTLAAYAISYATDSTQHYVIYPDFYSENDSISYTMLNHQLSTILARITRPTVELYLEYYFDDGDLKFIRHREWNQRPENSGAREIHFYLENQRIIFVRERTVSLDLTEPPARIAFKKMQPSQRPIEALNKDKDDYWPKINAFVEEDLNQRSAQ
jgi:hypothetical protein